MESQNKMILNDLMTGCRITGLDALKNYGCIKFSNRISELRAEGFNIEDTWLDIKTKYGKKRVKQYFMK
jgi:hypothetical protein